MQPARHQCPASCIACKITVYMANRYSLQCELHVLQLLFDSEFQRVEKIKVAGYTYMAACGLEPGRRDSSASFSSSGSSGCSFHNTDHTIVLAKFATRMMAVLKALNKDAFQNFSLRVGKD